MSSSNVYTLDTDHNTPLHHASQNGHADVVILLLSKNASVDPRNAFGQTSIHPSSHRLAGRADNFIHNSALDTEHNTPLHYASQSGHTDIVNLVLSKKTIVYSRKEFVETSLNLAVKHGRGRVENLIYNGANVNACNKGKKTALHLACQNGHISVVEILLDNHARVDVTKQSDETPFYLAAKNGHAEVTDLLLRRGVCDFVLTDEKETPLHVAVQNGHKEVVEVILKHESKISGKLLSCRHRPTLQGNANYLTEPSGIHPIQLLRDDGRRLSAGIVWSEENKPLVIWEASGEHKLTALDLAVKSNQPKMVKLLLNSDQGAYSEEHLGQAFYHLRQSRNYYMVTDSREDNETATDLTDAENDEMFSKNTNSKEIARALINSSKFNVNLQSWTGETPISHVIVDIGCARNVIFEKIHSIYFLQLLLENGADFNLKNYKGETPLMIASMYGCCDAIQILFDWEQKSGIKLDLDARDRYGETALMKAVANDKWCRSKIIQSDWLHNSEIEVDIDVEDRYGATALIIAAERRHVSVMRLLLNHKATVNLSDYYGLTALHAAIYYLKTNWFDLQIFCKEFSKLNFDGASSSFETSSQEKLQLRGEIMDSHRLIEYIQSHLKFIEGTILSRADMLNHMERESGDPDVVFHRLLINLRLRLEAVKLLLVNDETIVNAMDFRGYTPLDLAMESVIETNSTSLKAIAPLEVGRIDDRGRNPLHRLIISHFSDCIFQYHYPWKTEQEQDEEHLDLMVKGIWLNPGNFSEMATATDNKGRTPLHYTVMTPSLYNCDKSRGLVKLLLELGSEVNAADIYGKTPLHYAGDDLYELLVNCGADKNTKDNFENKPSDLRKLRDLVTINIDNAWRWEYKDNFLHADIAQVLNTNHVTELTRRKLVETIHIYSQSPRPKESSETTIWRIWTQNKFIRLNRRLSQLKPSVKQFIQRLADGMKENDWRFECQPILVGSAEEETKVVLSADFDFNFKLNKFSQLCAPFPHPLGPKGYFQLRRKTNEDTESRGDEMFDSFFNSDHCLLTDKVNSRCKLILEEVLSDSAFWQNEDLFDWNMKHRYINRYVNHDSMCTTMILAMLNPIEDGEGGFIFVEIKIDVTACIRVEDWWPEDALPIEISPAVKTDGSTFVFRRPSVDFCRSCGSHFTFSNSYARISFAPLESLVLKESSHLIKAAYMVCKMICYSGRETTYQLKTCLLFCMEALNARDGNETKVEDNITRKQLVFWVERIMFCFMEFSRHHVFPCYFMPSFRQEVKHLTYISDGHICVKRGIDEKVNRDLIIFSYCQSYDLYLDLCPDETGIDMPVERKNKSRNRDTNIDSFWKPFDRKAFTSTLSSRRSH